jgi:hypothetical protein
MSRRQKLGDDARADKAGGAGEEDTHGTAFRYCSMRYVGLSSIL